MLLRPFLTANWSYLAMLNYRIDPAVLEPLVPMGTELDFVGGETYVSIVGFLFLNTRLLGLPVPLHRDFEEVNLRFYVRRKSADTWRRGVVFVREFVPRRAIAAIANAFYGERYTALPMKHDVKDVDGTVSVEYAWRRGSKWESMKISANGDAQVIPAGSHEEFITEHYWGYTAHRIGCSEYRVEHPRWKIWPAEKFELRADVAVIYGQNFVDALSSPPVSAFIADGSHVEVQRRETLV